MRIKAVVITCLIYMSLVVLYSPSFADLLPPVSDNDGDATLTLTMESAIIVGVENEWGNIRIQVTGEDVPLVENDSVHLVVYEDDTIFDEIIFETTIYATAAEASEQLIDRTIPLVFTVDDLSLEPDLQAEFFSEAMVDKDIILVKRHGKILKLDDEEQIRSTGPSPDIPLSYLPRRGTLAGRVAHLGIRAHGGIPQMEVKNHRPRHNGMA